MDSRATTVVLVAFGIGLWLYLRNSAIANQRLAAIESARAQLMRGDAASRATNGSGRGRGVQPFVHHATPTSYSGSLVGGVNGSNPSGGYGASGGFTLGRPVGFKRVYGKRPKIDGGRHSVIRHATVDAAHVKLQSGAPYTYITYNTRTNGAYSGVNPVPDPDMSGGWSTSGSWEDAAEWVTELIFF